MGTDKTAFAVVVLSEVIACACADFSSSFFSYFLFLPYDCLLHHNEDYAILIFVRHAQRIVKPKFKSVSK